MMAQGLETPTKKKKTSPSWTSQHFLALILSYLIYLPPLHYFVEFGK